MLHSCLRLEGCNGHFWKAIMSAWSRSSPFFGTSWTRFRPEPLFLFLWLPYCFSLVSFLVLVVGCRRQLWLFGRRRRDVIKYEISSNYEILVISHIWLRFRFFGSRHLLTWELAHGNPWAVKFDVLGLLWAEVARGNDGEASCMMENLA